MGTIVLTLGQHVVLSTIAEGAAEPMRSRSSRTSSSTQPLGGLLTKR